MRLTTPPQHALLPANLPLHYEADGAFFKRYVPYVGEPAPIDLANVGRIGSFTTAEWWRAIERTPEQEELFQMLLKALDDEDPRVQSQAAYYLSLLKDERSEPKIEAAKRAALAKELDQRPKTTVTQAWVAGPFPDSDKLASHPPEQGVIDLAAEYAAGGSAIRWEQRTTGARGFTTPDLKLDRSSTYLYFRVQSAVRQPARLRLAGHENVQLWHSGIRQALAPAEEKPGQQAILDLQPGSNELLVRAAGPAISAGLAMTLHARGDISLVLPEKLDGSLLAERLRSAAEAGSGEMLSPEFAALDWPAEAKKGDAAKGRALFGTLGCGKCHAITSDQKGGGARAQPGGGLAAIHRATNGRIVAPAEQAGRRSLPRDDAANCRWRRAKRPGCRRIEGADRAAASRRFAAHGGRCRDRGAKVFREVADAVWRGKNARRIA
jgi:hypothetical protein